MVSTALLSRNPWVARRPLTVVDYHRMGEAGILSRDDRVELIEGELVAMSPIGSRHAGAINRLNQFLVLALGKRSLVAVQNPIRLSDRTEPQPDLAVLRPRADGYSGAPPGLGDVLLVVEVADSSLAYDRTVEVPLYAAHGIPEFWIVDVSRQEIEVHCKPEGDRYAVVTRAGLGGRRPRTRAAAGGVRAGRGGAGLKEARPRRWT